jgi:hypothetical protein
MNLETGLEVVERRRKIALDNQSRGPSKNGRVVIIEGIAYRITCPKFKECKAPSYNNGFVKYLCSGNHGECAAENPDIYVHENFAGNGDRARFYPVFLKLLEEKEQREIQQRQERLRLNWVAKADVKYA